MTMRVILMSALFAIAASSCGGNGPLGPVSDGTANISASGAVSAGGDGVAIFQSISSGGIDLFQIAAAPTVGGGVWQLQIVRYAQRPAPGTYQLSGLSPSSPNPTANFYYGSGGSPELFNATSGELVIISSSTTAVRGTFTFTATSTTNGTRSVTVQGSFAALCPPGTTCL
jgi:hypothetical protein